MTRYLLLAFGVLTIGLLGSARQNDKPQSSAAAGNTLKVVAHYKGAGTVDESHKVYIVLWDSPDFAGGGASGPPIEVKGVSSKNGSVTFTGLTHSPVYASSVYDPTGAWDAQSAPPAGSSMGIYSKEPGKPAPIEVSGGKTATVDLAFDDSVKMQ